MKCTLYTSSIYTSLHTNVTKKNISLSLSLSFSDSVVFGLSLFDDTVTEGDDVTFCLDIVVGSNPVVVEFGVIVHLFTPDCKLAKYMHITIIISKILTLTY